MFRGMNGHSLFFTVCQFDYEFGVKGVLRGHMSVDLSGVRSHTYYEIFVLPSPLLKDLRDGDSISSL